MYISEGWGRKLCLLSEFERGGLYTLWNRCCVVVSGFLFELQELSRSHGIVLCWGFVELVGSDCDAIFS